MIYNILFCLPCHSSLNYWFNLGSFLGITLVFQVISGLLLLLGYRPTENYDSIIYLTFEISYGWFIKLFHRNNASIIFFLLYLHLYKNLMIFRYRLGNTWNSGILIIILLIGAGFTGYVLVGSQISFWAAIVITSLLSVVPLNGEVLIYFVWGGFSVSWITLQLLFVVHFILPFIVLIVIIFHLISLHSRGSTSVYFSHRGINKIRFYPYYWVKDLINISIYLFFIFIILILPYSLGEVELFEETNTLSSPVHIVPEWYFCIQYAILRSVPSKSIGVVIILLSILVFFIYPSSIGYISPASNIRRTTWIFFC